MRIHGSLTGFRVSATDAKKVWQLDPKYIHPFFGDVGGWRQLAVREGLVYAKVYEYAGTTEKGQVMVVVNAADGKVLHAEPFSYALFFLWGDKVAAASDPVHRPRGEAWELFDADPKNFKKLPGTWEINPSVHVATGGYNDPLYEVFSNGFAYFRTVEGYTCYDLRKP